MGVYDDAGRIVLREASNPSNLGSSGLVCWYYRIDDTASAGDDAVCTFACTMRITIQSGEESWIYGENNEPLMECTSYEITNYDKYGNETTVWVDAKCCMKTDADGYLQMIIKKFLGVNVVTRVDDSGRPLWSAIYDGQNGNLLGCTVWQYEMLE